jgi:hypothetical protein
LLQARSSSPLQYSTDQEFIQNSQRPPAPSSINPAYYPNRLPSDPSPSRSRLVYPQAKEEKKSLSSGERRRRCSAPAACWPATASCPVGSGCRGPTPTACAHQRSRGGGASRPPLRRPTAPLTSHRRRLHRLLRRSGSGTTRPPHHLGKIIFCRKLVILLTLLVSCECEA